MLLVALSLYIRKKAIDSFKFYLSFFFIMALCVALWAIYVDSAWIFLVWVGRSLLIAITNYLIAKHKASQQPQSYLSALITLIVATICAIADVTIYSEVYKAPTPDS